MTKMPKVVCVEWEDSCTTFGWQAPEKDGTTLIRSVGIVTAETKRVLTLSTSLSDGGRVVDQIAIPRSAIRKVKTISVKW